MICVLASITVKPGKKNDYLEIFSTYVPKVLEEDGCIEYTPMVDLDISEPIQVLDDCVVTIVEKWESVEHLNAHSVAPHMLELKEKVDDIVENVTLKVLANG